MCVHIYACFPEVSECKRVVHMRLLLFTCLSTYTDKPAFSPNFQTCASVHTTGTDAQMCARICTYSDREICAQEQQKVQYSRSLLHAVEVCVNARTYMHIFRGMYTNLGTCDLLVRLLRRWGKIQVNQHRSRSMCTRAAEGAILSLILTRRGGLSKCAPAYAHIQRYVH